MFSLLAALPARKGGCRLISYGFCGFVMNNTNSYYPCRSPNNLPEVFGRLCNYRSNSILNVIGQIQ